MSPVFLVDQSCDSHETHIVWPSDLTSAQLVAGSMGIVCRVSLKGDLVNALQRLWAKPYEVAVAMSKLSYLLYIMWPDADIALRPGASDGNEDRAMSRRQILMHLIKLAPLVAGCFSPIFGASHHLEDQILDRASYNSLRLKDLTIADLEADNKYLLRVYVALRRILLHPSTPVWPFYLLEDIMSVPIQELIRY